MMLRAEIARVSASRSRLTTCHSEPPPLPPPRTTSDAEPACGRMEAERKEDPREGRTYIFSEEELGNNFGSKGL